MKKSILALALVGCTLGAFAQTTPTKTKSKPATAVTKTAKSDTMSKHKKEVKKTHEKK